MARDNQCCYQLRDTQSDCCVDAVRKAECGVAIHFCLVFFDFFEIVHCGELVRNFVFVMFECDLFVEVERHVQVGAEVGTLLAGLVCHWNIDGTDIA